MPTTSPAPRANTAAAGKPVARRDDLDALRGFAMLLGIVLHAILAYFPFPWPVQDPFPAPQPGGLQRLLPLAYVAIHSFRLPLFFLLSGFFTMLVFSRRGIRAVLEQRALRLLLPLAIAMATIQPITSLLKGWAVRRSTAATAARSPLQGRILAGDADGVRELLAKQPGLPEADSAADPISHLSPLSLAAMAGDTEIIQSLLDAGFTTQAASGRDTPPLQSAAFMGRDEAVKLLLARGADASATNPYGKTALDSLAFPPGSSVLAGEFVGLRDLSAAGIEVGRRRVRELLAPLTSQAASRSPLDAFTARYREAIASPWLSIDVAGRSLQLFETNVFDHLWFLWYLWWLVVAFAAAVRIGLVPTGRLRWWLVPASCAAFLPMWSPYGPDTALGLVPVPHLFLFYGCFFWFGAATYAAEGAEMLLGRRWPVLMPAALFLFFAGLATAAEPALASIVQPGFAWCLSIGLIGLFRQFFSQERLWVRWLSDASYWMYLAHLPVVIACQSALITLPWPVALKLFAVLAATVGGTLVTYRWCVRYTPIGWLLNGPRLREVRPNGA
jgi:peptidoglycan/LPS O-acetylase OafA/YrhL